MLALLVGNSLRLIQEHLVKQTERRIEAIELAYKTAVTIPLASRDYATLRDILDGWREAEDIRYLVVTDPKGQILASSGWETKNPLPVSSQTIKLGSIQHVVLPVTYLGQNYGAVHYGMDLSFLESARNDLFVQGSLIAVGEILLSLLLLSTIGYWLTRQLVTLSNASEQIAAGDYKTNIAVHGQDEIGRLAANFNRMATAIDARINELAISESRQRALITGLGEGVYGVNSKGQCTFINPAALQMLGHHKEDVIGRDQHALFHHSNADGGFYPADHCPIWLTLQDGEPRRAEEWFWCKDGSVIPVLLSVTPLIEKDKVEGAIAVFIDLSAQNAAKEELRAAKIAAEEANVAKSRFLANMSHEIRTPLNGVLGMTQILEMTNPTDEQKEYLKTIKESANGLLHIVNDILDISKIEAGKISLENIPFSLQQTCYQLQDLLSPSALEKELLLEIELADDLPELLLGDPTRIRQILINLISNAIKFTATGTVKLRCHLIEASDEIYLISLQVSDTGIGMSSEIVEKLFTSFYQGDASTTRKYGGTGLGLAICKRFVEMMGGEIKAESTLNHGSKFTVKLPFSREGKSTS